MPTSATGGLESRRRLIFLARCPNKHADVGPVGPTTNDLVNLGKRSRPDVGSTSAGLRLDVGTCGHIRRPADVGPRLNRRWADVGPSLGPTSGRRRHVYWDEPAAATLIGLRIQKPLRTGAGGPFGRGLAEVMREVEDGPSIAPVSYSLTISRGQGGCKFFLRCPGLAGLTKM